MLPILVFSAALVLLPAAILHCIRKRQTYCGKEPDPCFWCRRRCDYYNLGEAGSAASR